MMWFAVTVNYLLFTPTIYYLQKNTFIVEMQETNTDCFIKGLMVCQSAVLSYETA